MISPGSEEIGQHGGSTPGESSSSPAQPPVGRHHEVLKAMASMRRDDMAVRVRGVTKHFGEGANAIRALRGIDMDIASNQLMLLVGPSGCGKTTLLSVICGVLNADHGSCDVFGVDWHKLSEAEKTQRRGEIVGYVFQQFNLIPTLPVVDNVAVPLLIRGMKRPEALERAAKSLESVGLGDRAKSMPTQLSGGQQQRVAIARALVHEPRLLVCDEPTANLDSRTGNKIMEILKAASHPPAGHPSRCVIVVTHDMRLFHHADRIEQMEDGRLIEPLNPKDFAVEMHGMGKH